MTAMPMEEVHQRTGEQQQVRSEPKCMLPVLTENEERKDHRERGCEERPFATPNHIRVLLNLSELPITLTDESAMAAAAMIGDSKSPNAG